MSARTTHLLFGSILLAGFLVGMGLVGSAGPVAGESITTDTACCDSMHQPSELSMGQPLDSVVYDSASPTSVPPLSEGPSLALRQSHSTLYEESGFKIETVHATTPVEGDPLVVTTTVENTGDETDTQAVELAVEGLGSNETELTLEAGETTEQNLTLATGEGDAGEYNATVTTETDSDELPVEVLEPPPPIVDDAPPTDTTGDGLYNDIDGAGEFTIRDIQALFMNLDTDGVQEYAWAFDFAGLDAETVDIFDLQALFNQFQYSPSLVLEPIEAEAEPSSEHTFTIAVERAWEGIAAYDFTLETDNAVVTFDEEHVEFLHDGGIQDAVVSHDGSELTLQVITGNNQLPPAGTIDLANVTVAVQDVDSGESTDFEFAVDTITDEDNHEYETVHSRISTLTVRESSTSSVSTPSVSARET